jgi:hypothetical protein
MIGKKKLTPASIISQKSWAGLSTSRKKALCRALPDYDKDSVPNCFDCRPKNKRRQESFLPDDENYINANYRNIVPDKQIGSGSNGVVFSLKGNNNLVVKLPHGFMPDRPSEILSQPVYCNRLGEEINTSKEINLNNEPLLTPTKVVKIKRGDAYNSVEYGMVRPKVTPITEMANPYKGTITMSQIEDIRKKIVALSHRGYAFTDGIQLGLDRIGRPIIYDLGLMRCGRAGSDSTFNINDKMWQDFLYHIDKWDGKKSTLERFGRITKN